MKIFGYHTYDGLLQFEAQYPDDVEPAEVAGLAISEMEAPAGTPPFDGARYNINTGEWIDARTMADRKATKWQEIKAARDRAEFGGFYWGGSKFDSNQKSQARIQGAIQMSALAPGYSVDWTLADNTVRSLTATDLAEIGVALASHVASQHAAARVLRQRIDAAETVQQIESIAWGS